jgi:hypothetical protein
MLRVAVTGAPGAALLLFRRRLGEVSRLPPGQQYVRARFLVSLVSLKQFIFTRISLYFSIYYLCSCRIWFAVDDRKLRVALGP